ncbi:glycosyltransferase family 2 protein, partial [Marisediminicola senii]|uniref:glycosyltransferase family 2 protein n=1 Tax=Marisediminicola senii TaxID=2711233 RepID=UPI0013ED2824
MQQRVTAIVVARSGADFLPRTLASLQTQTRAPDQVIAVDAGSTDTSRELLSELDTPHLVAAGNRATFGEAVATGVRVAPFAGARRATHAHRSTGANADTTPNASPDATATADTAAARTPQPPPPPPPPPTPPTAPPPPPPSSPLPTPHNPPYTPI